MQDVSHVNYYTEFQRVCRIYCTSSSNWFYTDIDCDLMYSDHRSWVYLIVVDGIVYKIGETGNPLGIRGIEWTTQGGPHEYQPSPHSSNRLGRYRKGCGTDQHCRLSLEQHILSGHLVEFWAYKCPELNSQPIILGGELGFSVRSQMHKQLELKLLSHFVQHMGHLPYLNKAHC